MQKIVIPLSIITLIIAALFLMPAFSSFQIKILAQGPPPGGAQPPGGAPPGGPPQEIPPPPTGLPETGVERLEAAGASSAPPEEEETPATIATAEFAFGVPITEQEGCEVTVSGTWELFVRIDSGMGIAGLPFLQRMLEETSTTLRRALTDPDDPSVIGEAIDNLEDELEDEYGDELDPHETALRIAAMALQNVIRGFLGGIEVGGGRVVMWAGVECEIVESGAEITGAMLGLQFNNIADILGFLGIIDTEAFWQEQAGKISQQLENYLAALQNLLLIIEEDCCPRALILPTTEGPAGGQQPPTYEETAPPREPAPPEEPAPGGQWKWPWQWR